MAYLPASHALCFVPDDDTVCSFKFRDPLLDQLLDLPAFLDYPFPWIVFNVLPYFVVILLITDHMVVIGALKDRLSDFLCSKHLDGANNTCDPAVLRTDMGI